ncbi:MAG: hypothetical protein HYY44_09175 [Deltaproteobacteria bacterium]|nr:hypothetical protein [Deltaproteobacteria bacterium]MBI4374112.1 hypothetical protein [Deltaproteobacteria bacterium]
MKLQTLFFALLFLTPVCLSAETGLLKWSMNDPQVFNLQIPKNLFIGKLAGSPQVATCHTQGLAVTDSQILISCCLYDAKDKKERSYRNDAYLLSADITSVFSAQPNQKPDWALEKITEWAPLEESERIAKSVLEKKSAFDPARELFPMGHPSGIAFDKERRGVWLALSVYGPRSYSRIKQFNIPDHLGAVVPLRGNLIVGLTWGSQEFLVLDTNSGEWRRYPNKLPEQVDYQECDALAKSLFICSGNLIDREWFLKRRIGKIHILELQGDHFDSFHFVLKGEVEGDLGVREFSDQKDKGVTEKRQNQYGPYSTPLTLTNEGMSLSPDKKFIYFLPEDIPGGRIVRYRLTPSSSNR